VTDLPPDPYVRRANQFTTTFFDALAVLLLSAGAGVAGWQLIALWVGLMFAAVTLMILSALAQWRASARPPRPTVVDDETIPLPGPADPGNLHVMGR
jgi:hypothetical protein